MAKAERIKVQCQECGKRFATSHVMPECPKCGGVDIDLPMSGPARALNTLGVACVQALKTEAR